MVRRSKGTRHNHLMWRDVRDGDRVIGRYATDRGLIIVRHADGWEKITQSSGGGSNEEVLARVILSEGPPPGW
jgi:hypothetical protein